MMWSEGLGYSIHEKLSGREERASDPKGQEMGSNSVADTLCALPHSLSGPHLSICKMQMISKDSSVKAQSRFIGGPISECHSSSH